ncbi:MAG: class I SAM-dependent methyltransferase, partial [Patescibacteria group bacterium]|nr:class I SAM-dependent methyltransferase [Patescibacteria group bacterium]
GEFIKLNPKQIEGIDNNSATVLACRRQGLRVNHVNALKLPFKDQSFAGVHCSHVIEHLLPKDAYTLLKELARVLKLNGLLVIQTPILWSGFYDNLTHIKPYSSSAIMRYLCQTAPDTTFPRLSVRFKQIALTSRYRNFTKTGYILVLKREK